MTVAPGHRVPDTTDPQLALPEWATQDELSVTPEEIPDPQTSACEDDSVLIQPLPAGLAAVYISRSVTRAEEDRIRAALGVPARTTNRRRRKA